MKIGLLGFGVVGEGVWRLMEARGDMEVVRVLCRRDRTLPGTQVTHDFEDILRDDAIDTVVEVMGGLEPAWDYVRRAAAAGKHIVTANKALAAAHYDELLELTEKHGVRLRCTAAVGGGIGWLPALERARRCDTVTRVGGIMNGTCNYILDSMTRLGMDYGEALRQAQALGYAEADPSADVDGTDTWNKLILSANIAFGVSLDTAAVPAAGVRQITAGDVQAFAQHGLVCRLVGEAARQDGAFRAWVQPALFPAGAPEAAVSDNDNLITFEGGTVGRQSFLGQGAGRWPTAYNVVQDCADLLEGRGFYCRRGPAARVDNGVCLRYYVRGGEDEWLTAHATARWGQAVVTGPVPAAGMHAWLRAHPQAFAAALPADADERI